MFGRKARVGLGTVCLCTTLSGTALLHGAEPDIVVYAADAVKLQGRWSRVTDLTAAGKQFLSSLDLGWQTATPLASPKDYVEFSVSAPANTAYHVWVRLRARGNSTFNDSVFLQFSDSVNESGLPLYRIGGVSALTVNLQAGNDAALSGWGWVDGAYWLTQTSIIKFTTSGSHTLRVQAREDGVQLDQIVLSPAAYLRTTPGSPRNDTTLVRKPTAVASTPSSGTSAAVPGTSQADGFAVGSASPAVSGTPVALPGTSAPANLTAGSKLPLTDPATPPIPAQIVTAPPSAAPTVVTVSAGSNLQAAIDAAQPGDTLLLEAGATFIGNFTLPAKNGSSYITIRSAAPDAQLPGPGVRMNPAYAPLLPKIKSPNRAPAIATEPGAHHYRLMLLEFPSTAQPLDDIITLGEGTPAQNSPALVPYELVLDRVYVHGDPIHGQKRGVALNGASTSVLNSYIADIKAVGQDSQALGGWNGPGPFTIENNYLEAAGENILFGGADPSITNLVPSDIVIRRNHLSKRLAWMREGWTVKSLLELKNAQRVVIDGNLIENNWMAGQSGPAVLFAPRNQGGTAPWSVVQHVQFTNNIVRHVSGGFHILGRDTVYQSQETNDIVIRNNIFEDISSARYGGWGGLALIAGGRDIVFDHNTALLDGTWAVFADGPVQNFVFTNNIIPDNNWAIVGTGTPPGTPSISYYFPGSTIRATIIAGPYGYMYPPGNYYPTSLNAVGFVNLAGGNYRLSSSSVYRNAGTDGKDVGCDIGAVNAAAGSSY